MHFVAGAKKHLIWLVLLRPCLEISDRSKGLTNHKLHVSHPGNIATTAGKQTHPNLVSPAPGEGQCPHHNVPRVALRCSADISNLELIIGPLYQEGL